MGLQAKGSGTSIYAFFLMTNHAQILLDISTCMRRLLTGYAQYFNRRHQRVGHLFQNRYKSIICEEEVYFGKLVAYNQVQSAAGLVETLKLPASYFWCSHVEFLGTFKYYEMDRNYVLRFFTSGWDRQRKLISGFSKRNWPSSAKRCCQGPPSCVSRVAGRTCWPARLRE